MGKGQSISERGFTFFLLSLFAFAGLGLEALLAFLIEPLVYGKGLSDFSTAESLLHWIITCVIWGLVSSILMKIAKARLEFDMFSKKPAIGVQRWAFCFGLLAVSMTVSIIDWNGLKVVKEFLYNGWLKFIFQYIYYIFEAVLFILIIVFAQEAGEIWFKKGNIPWGGILVSLTWGLAHIFTKGNLLVGILSFLGGLFYGSVYIISKKNLYIAYPIILLMFIL